MIIVILSILFFLKLYHSIKGGNNLSNFLILLYLLTFVCSFLFNYFQPQKYINVLASIYLILVILLWILPFRDIKDRSVVQINYSQFKFNRLVNIISFLGFISTSFFLYNSLSILNISDISDARKIASDWGVLSPGPITTCFVIYSSLFHINLLLYFISVCRKDKRIISYLLLYSSFSFPLMCLCFFGRDGVVYWILNFIILLFLFKRSMPKHILKRIKYFFSVISICSLIVFSLMSMARFGANSNSDYKMIDGTLGYLGQQYNNFSKAFFIDINEQTIFPGLRSALEKVGILDEIKNYDRDDFYSSQGAGDDYYVFGYFVKNFVWSFGAFPALLLSIFVYKIVRKKCVLFNGHKRLEDLIVIFSLFQVPLLGLFYYRQSVTRMDVGYLITFIIYMYLRKNKKVYGHNLRK